jgi:alpha-galactosidase
MKHAEVLQRRGEIKVEGKEAIRNGKKARIVHENEEDMEDVALLICHCVQGASSKSHRYLEKVRSKESRNDASDMSRPVKTSSETMRQ